jgi:hypothetical protein
MNNYDKHQNKIKGNFKNNLLITMIGALIGCSMLLVSNAEQGTIEQIAEQRINKTLADTKS